MKVDYNNLRQKAVNNWNNLAKKLNNTIYDTLMGDSAIRIDIEDIRDELDDIRTFIVIMACTSIPNDDDFKEILGDTNSISAIEWACRNYLNSLQRKNINNYIVKGKDNGCKCK